MAAKKSTTAKKKVASKKTAPDPTPEAVELDPVEETVEETTPEPDIEPEPATEDEPYPIARTEPEEVIFGEHVFFDHELQRHEGVAVGYRLVLEVEILNNTATRIYVDAYAKVASTERDEETGKLIETQAEVLPIPNP